MRDRCSVAQAGEVFLAPVSWRPSPRCTSSASPCACLTSGLEGLELERPFESPNLGCSQLTSPASEETGSCSALGLAFTSPTGKPVGSLTFAGHFWLLGNWLYVVCLCLVMSICLQHTCQGVPCLLGHGEELAHGSLTCPFGFKHLP